MTPERRTELLAEIGRFLDNVETMRHNQKRYFQSRKNSVDAGIYLNLSKEKERVIDANVRRIQSICKNLQQQTDGKDH
jgi:hypothetical protein